MHQHKKHIFFSIKTIKNRFSKRLQSKIEITGNKIIIKIVIKISFSFQFLKEDNEPNLRGLLRIIGDQKISHQ